MVFYMRVYFFFHFLSLLFLLLSCAQERGEHEALFRQVETIVAERPDSALALLGGIACPEELGDDERARYYLLRTEAEDKAYVEHTTDSLIAIAARYYDSSDSLRLRAKAWYYMGRVNQELDRPLEAQEYYLNALRDEERVRDDALFARINNYIGTLYTFQSVYEQALPYLKKALQYYRINGDSVGQLYVWRNMARIYSVTAQEDSAIYAYRKAVDLTKIEMVWSVYAELGNLYMENGNLDLAWQYLEPLKNHVDSLLPKVDGYSFCAILGEYYNKINQLDSAQLYLDLCMDKTIRIDIRMLAYSVLKDIEKKRKNWKRYVQLDSAYLVLRDSFLIQEQTESIRKNQALYDYQEKELELANERAKNAEYESDLTLTISSCILIILTIVLVFYRIHRKEKREQEEKDRQLQAHADKIREYEERIASFERLRSGLDDGQDPQNEVRARLEEEIEGLREKVSQHEAQAARIAFANSSLYARFLDDISWTPSSDDWAELFRAVDEMHPTFAPALQRDLPDLALHERRLCYLVKIKIKPRRIAQLLGVGDNNVSMWRKRLYKRATGKEGGAKDFDRYILSL